MGLIDLDERKYYRAMFTFHAATFMSERRQYYARRTEALNYPDSFCSIIMDGMAQVIYLIIICRNKRVYKCI